MTSRDAAHAKKAPRVDSIPPIEMSVSVACPVADAFQLFTQGIDSWWPRARYSVAQQEGATCVFEPGIGGRLYERLEDGEEHEWGRVLAWEPPNRVVFSWHPGRSPETAQEVELRFLAAGEGTRVELVHRGWERFGVGAEETRGQYIEGWGFVLGEQFVTAARGQS